jgi:uncharacterized alkaline shock family protein YloU
MTEGQASISADILARYAGDAALEVEGVRSLSRRKSVRIDDGDGDIRVEIHLAVDWGASVPDIGSAVQARIREYLARMADIEPSVDVVVDEFGPAS